MSGKIGGKALNWAELGFEYVRTDVRFAARWRDGEWDAGALLDSEIMPLHEGSPALHYAQQCFEGLKAQCARDGRVLLFRPNLNSERMNEAAGRLLMPQVPKALFLRGVETAVRENRQWIPPFGSGASLYVRPLLIGIGENLGLRPAKEFEFRVFVSPVGPYYKQAGMAPISLAVSGMDRAAPQGTGRFKIGANYAGGLLATQEAQREGANEALYLDAAENRYIDEAGSANILVALRDGSLATPRSAAVLPSVNRRSLMQLAADRLGMKTAERPIDLRAEFGEFTEMAACGTAAVLSPISRIWFDDAWHEVNPRQNGEAIGPVMRQLYDLLVGIQQGEIAEPYGWVHEVVL
ncbi:MAG: branched-chain amino acid aminotransferase [Gammaproteobacteria bacterium]|nr:branched-chain amino acid aminotransferase [Gammaproteobacteria bacterium]